ncbi:MAG: TIGR00725 family protein [Clostridia bacterium]
MRKIVAVIGDAIVEKGTEKYNIAYQTGKAIIEAGYRLQCGGLGGVMKAACKGAKSATNYREGDIIGILPSFDVNNRNEYVDIPIPTGLDVYRNVIVASASAVVAIGGGGGTLSELAHAWSLKRLILAYSNCGGWGEKLAGERVDGRIRYPNIPEDKVYGVTSPQEMSETLKKYIDKYDIYHTGITIHD